MKDFRVATAQFETRDGDKTYNLSRIDELCARAIAQGAQLVCFHELSVTGYTFLERLSRTLREALGARLVALVPSVEEP